MLRTTQLHGAETALLRSTRLSANCETSLSLRAFQIQREQFFKNLFVGQIGGPTVGGGDGFVELAVGEIEPGGAFVVEVGERALRQLCCAFRVRGHKSRIADGADAVFVGVGDVAGPGAGD